ncbi:MAG: helix-turn-helix domain-containing protein [Clostridia bacterium]|nr:helix-turn-helix domain-containing protein [Clostridia bacterium]
MTTGEKIAKLRKERGLTQEELAEKLGVTRQSVSRWESDAAFPETDKLITMSNIFGCSVDYILKYGGQTAQPLQQNNFAFRDWHFEYKSQKTVGGVPLVHVNIGFGRTAKGIFAVGLKAYGVFAVGLLACGVFSFGLLAFGVIALGMLGLGFAGLGAIGAGVFALGGVAVGIISLGGVALGLFALGGCSVGAFAFGGYAYGSYIAIGDVAHGGIALGGHTANGSVLSVTADNFKQSTAEIYEKFNNIPQAFSLFTNWCKSLFESVLNGSITLGNIKI